MTRDQKKLKEVAELLTAAEKALYKASIIVGDYNLNKPTEEPSATRLWAHTQDLKEFYNNIIAASSPP